MPIINSFLRVGCSVSMVVSLCTHLFVDLIVEKEIVKRTCLSYRDSIHFSVIREGKKERKKEWK